MSLGVLQLRWGLSPSEEDLCLWKLVLDSACHGLAESSLADISSLVWEWYLEDPGAVVVGDEPQQDETDDFLLH